MSLPFAVALIVAAATLPGCDALSERPLEPDAAWHKQALIDGHLSHWLAAAPSESGFLQTNVTRTWQRREQKSTDLTAQSHQIYVLLSGYELTGDPRYLDAARAGADFLLRYFRDPVNGGFFRVVAADGRVLNDAKFAYGHALVIFALAHAYRVTKDERYRDAAFAAWRTINFGLRDSSGGFRISAPRDFAVAEESRVLDPVSHLLEAMLALHEATGDAEALAGVRQIGDFLLYKMLQGRPDGTAFFPEWYDAAWGPLPQGGGGYIDLGHQAEVAYLLDVAGARGLSPIYPAAAQRVADYVLKVGYDESVGGCYSRAVTDGTVTRDKGWWQQSGCLRMLMRFAARYGKPDMKRRYEQTLAFVREEFIDTANGGWYPRMKSQCARSPCPDEQPDAYHMVGLHREALDLAAARANAAR
jgi:mannose/cellobiose epimerase-like protein (N-acyl-D-glucosamine 2-epimerase family)